VYLEQVAPHHSKKVAVMITLPATTMKASKSGTMPNSHQKRGQKRGVSASGLFSDVVGLEPTGDNERGAKKSSLKPNGEATDHNVVTPRRPAKKAKTQEIQCTGMFTHNT
jgi:hypothetical protein